MTWRISGRTWSPELLGSSLALWLDADDASTITLNGSNVSQWNDKSGNNRHATQATAENQPVYTANAINGLSALVFDGVNSSLGDFLEGSFTASAFTIGMVATLTDNTFTAYYPIGFGGTTGVITGGTAVNQKAVLFNGSTSILTNESVQLNTPYLLTGNGSASGRAVSLNGGTQATDANSQSITDFRVGRRSNDFGPTPGPIGEIVIADAVLSTAERQKLEGYLAWKWGLVANLPAGHPYKTFPPSQ